MFYTLKEIHVWLLLLVMFFDKCVYLGLLKESKAVLFTTAYMFDCVCCADENFAFTDAQCLRNLVFPLGMGKMTSVVTSDSLTACLATLGLWRSLCSRSHMTNTWHLYISRRALLIALLGHLVCGEREREFIVWKNWKITLGHWVSSQAVSCYCLLHVNLALAFLKHITTLTKLQSSIVKISWTRALSFFFQLTGFS